MALVTEEKRSSDGVANGQDGDLAAEQPLHDEAAIQCPPHTTEARLLAKIDLRVLPFLCIMYLLAFLGKLIPLICAQTQG